MAIATRVAIVVVVIIIRVVVIIIVVVLLLLLLLLLVVVVFVVVVEIVVLELVLVVVVVVEVVEFSTMADRQSSRGLLCMCSCQANFLTRKIKFHHLCDSLHSSLGSGACVILI